MFGSISCAKYQIYQLASLSLMFPRSSYLVPALSWTNKATSVLSHIYYATYMYRTVQRTSIHPFCSTVYHPIDDSSPHFSHVCPRSVIKIRAFLFLTPMPCRGEDKRESSRFGLRLKNASQNVWNISRSTKRNFLQHNRIIIYTFNY